MRIIITKKYSDTELRREFEAGTERTVLRKRGLKLIESGVARLISDDDIFTDEITHLEKIISEQQEKIKRLEASNTSKSLSKAKAKEETAADSH